MIKNKNENEKGQPDRKPGGEDTQAQKSMAEKGKKISRPNQTVDSARMSVKLGLVFFFSFFGGDSGEQWVLGGM